MKKPIFLGMIAIATTLVLFVSALAASVSNGSFESGPSVPTNPGFTTLSTGSTAITDWMVTSGNIDYIGGYWTASDGTKSIDLNGTQAGAISQTLTTVVGATYTVSFDLAGNPAGAPAVKTMTVSATGTPAFAYTFDTSGHSLSAMGWASHAYSFVATSASTTLAFTSTTGGNYYGPALDNVRIGDNIVTSKDQCKKGGWEQLVDSGGNAFKNQGDCVSFVATGGKNLGAG